MDAVAVVDVADVVVVVAVDAVAADVVAVVAVDLAADVVAVVMQQYQVCWKTLMRSDLDTN